MNTIIYWISTSLVALMMVVSSYTYLFLPKMKEAIYHLGFPDYFRVELAVAKIVGVIVLLLPLSMRLKEWAYPGFTIFVSAFIAHIVNGNPIGKSIRPIVFLVILFVFYFSLYRLKGGI